MSDESQRSFAGTFLTSRKHGGRADEKEAAAKARDDADLRQLITHLSSSGLYMEVSGVVWLAVGIVLDTIPTR